MKKTALVTGGAGFIGSHLVDLLLQEGWRVRVLDDFSTGSADNLREAAATGGPLLEIREGDVRSRKACREACRDVDSVFHLAGLSSVAGSVASPQRAHAVNLTGTLNLLIAARDTCVRRFVFSSSASVYGDTRTSPIDEDQPCAPQSPYASQKACGELYCRNFYDHFGLETVVLRYFNVFGPRQSAKSDYTAAIPRFAQAALTNAAPVVFGDGLQTRDFVYVENVAAANLRATLANDVGGETFNIAGGRSISLLDLLDELQHCTGMMLKPQFQSARVGDVRHSRASILRAQRILGYDPAISFTEGIYRTVQAVQDTGIAAAPFILPRLIASKHFSLVL